ncbi:STAS domain-containing protein [Pseudalkalibacillus salsuginis]|uniref:STAS domain-containing protein n=1 Tax=Pseudalkalibacillus salsuginis TaxID=2910972 RepID=UPI001F1D1F07|nr:STAS domain-containing protein [Pseudalkalibacillus salsuginis]MCF6408181.1 STAS domain-containing protein [Pseudalkalibacillus salsuginis]
MQRNKDLHRFLLDKAEQLTEDWYNTLDKSDPIGVYSSTDPEIIQNLKQQNYEFHLNLIEIFDKEEEEFFNNFEEWVIKTARDKEHIETPTHYVMREFIRVRKQYTQLINEFVEIHPGKYANEQIELWKEMIIKEFDIAMVRFTEEKNNYLNDQLSAQKAMINELSSPVIDLSHNVGLLPIVGDIDTHRAKTVLESTLQQCADRNIEHLYIDLSGVFMVDTMVAHEIFQLLHSLKLLGIETTLSGIRPEIAQTAVQLGIDFDNVNITSRLSIAMPT